MRLWIPGILAMVTATWVVAAPDGGVTLDQRQIEYEAAIQNLLQSHLMVGYPDLTVQPELPVTRYEWAAVASRLVWHFDLHLPARGYKPPDVPWDHWAEDACRVLTAARLYPAPPGVYFRGDQLITRGELALMAWNLVGAIKGITPPARLADIDRPYEKAAAELQRMGVLIGYPDGELHLEDTMPRWQVCLVAHRIANGQFR
ncbi:MAG: S-layer homology domain-containing protein [Acidobacteriota bacterium]|nr:S-layer homology domain-containing protein [Acidobacteriota bacterium]